VEDDPHPALSPPPVTPAPITLAQLEAAVRRAWSQDTSDDPDEWTPARASRGQCGVTSIVLRALLGGEIVMADVHGSHIPGERHAWNRLPGGVEVDLTADQFRAGEALGPAAVDEPYVTDTGVDRGALLLDRVRHALAGGP
jgi:hypothetical protein